MNGGYVQEPLSSVSCAVQGRPGRSAYEAAVSAGYTGTPEHYTQILGSLPATLTRLNIYNGRVDAILEYMGNQIANLELAVEALDARIAALEEPIRGTSPAASPAVGGGAFDAPPSPHKNLPCSQGRGTGLKAGGGVLPSTTPAVGGGALDTPRSPATDRVTNGR